MVPSGFRARSFVMAAASAALPPVGRWLRRSRVPPRIAPWKSVVSRMRSVGKRRFESIPSHWARVSRSFNASGPPPETPVNSPRRNDASPTLFART